MRSLVAIVVVLPACAAPPMGLGTGARVPSTRGGDVVVTGTAGIGAADGRQIFQAEASGALVVRRWFTIEAGGAFTQLAQDRDDGGEVSTAGGFPYLRPRFTVRGVSLAIALAGVGMGGGGGGFYGGIADAQLGYGTRVWSAYAGAYGHAFNVTSENSIDTSASQLRAGGEYTMPVGRARLGVAVEIYRHHDTLLRDGRTTESRFFGAGLKLRVSSAAFR